MKPNQHHIKVTKVLMEAFRNCREDRREFVEKIIPKDVKIQQMQDDEVIRTLQSLRVDPEMKEIVDDAISQYFSWEDAFRQIIMSNDNLKNVDYNQILMDVQPKVKLGNLHCTYIVALMSALKRYPEFDGESFKKLKAKKMQIKQQKNKKKAQSQSQSRNTQSNVNKKQEDKPVQTKQTVAIKQQQQKPIKIEKQIRKSNQEQVPKNIENKQKEIKKITQRQRELVKNKVAEKATQNRASRNFNLVKYLESRKQFTFISKQTISKEILNHLQRFMKDKIQNIIKVTKLRATGYEDDQTGDQFKYFSNKNQKIFKENRHLMIPQSDIKILKVRYPSKLEKYFRLRVSEQKQQEKIKNQFKQRMQTDKKNDKLVERYIFADQGETHELKNDDGPKKRERLIVPSQAIQFVIETDPWFGDLHIMQRTFYRGSSLQ